MLRPIASKPILNKMNEVIKSAGVRETLFSPTLLDPFFCVSLAATVLSPSRLVLVAVCLKRCVTFGLGLRIFPSFSFVVLLLSTELTCASIEIYCNDGKLCETVAVIM